MISVLHIDTGITYRGGQRQAGLLIKHLSKYDIRQYLAVPAESPLVALCRAYNILHFPIGGTNVGRLLGRTALRNFILDHNVDIIHAHDSHAHSMMVSLPFKAMRPKFVVTRRYPSRISFGSRTKYTGYEIRFVAISDYIRSILCEGGVRQDHIVLIPDMIELADYSAVNDAGRRNRSDGRFRLVSAGTFDASKGFLAAIKAVGILAKKRQDFVFTIYGNGDTFGKLRRYLHTYNLAKYIELPGWLDDVYAYWKGADIYVSPSGVEGFNSSLLEAMASGICPVVTDIPAHREIVRELETGLLFPVDNVELLASKLDFLMNNPEMRRKIAQRLHHAIAKFDVNIVTAQVYDLYQQLTIPAK